MKIHRYVVVWLVFMVMNTMPVLAAPKGPGWYNTTASDITLQIMPASPEPSQLKLPTGDAASASATSGNVADAITPDLQALAAGLQYDPVQIYAYVKHHIAYEHYYGAKKGALLTLLEGSGNDFDQGALLVALLRAAGYSAQYQYGKNLLYYSRADGNDLIHWLGLSPTAYAHLSWAETLALFNVTDPWPDITDEQRKKKYAARHGLSGRPRQSASLSRGRCDSGAGAPRVGARDG